MRRQWPQTLTRGVIVASLSLLLPLTAHSTDACRLRGGDLVSADVLCDLFTSVTLDLSTTLVGSWSTECWDGYTDDVNDPDTGLLTVTDLTHITYANVSDTNDGCI